jgi:hypothetical protein
MEGDFQQMELGGPVHDLVVFEHRMPEFRRPGGRGGWRSRQMMKCVSVLYEWRGYGE